MNLGEKGQEDLDGSANVDGVGFGLDKVAKLGTFQMVDAELNPGYPLQPRCHVRPVTFSGETSSISKPIAWRGASRIISAFGGGGGGGGGGNSILIGAGFQYNTTEHNIDLDWEFCPAG
ncbi:hypothetical protein U1Q18_045677 [Sarracenia purpurea var. burkii]